MTKPLPTRLMGRLLLGATMITWLGSTPGFAQGVPTAGPSMDIYGAAAIPSTDAAGSAMSPSVGMPTTASPGSYSSTPVMGTTAPAAAPTSPSPIGPNGITLGTILVYNGALGQPQGPALGNITTCAMNGMSAAGSTWPAISTLMSTTPVPSPASPPIYSPLATFPVTTTPVPTVPVGPSLSTVPSPTAMSASQSALASTIITPLGGTLPVPYSYGTANVIGFCNPTLLGPSFTPALPVSTSPTGAYGDAAIPLYGTETGGGGGLSPLVDVPPPVLYSPSGVPLQ